MKEEEEEVGEMEKTNIKKNTNSHSTDAKSKEEHDNVDYLCDTYQTVL